MTKCTNYVIVAGRTPLQYLTAEDVWSRDPLNALVFNTWRRARDVTLQRATAIDPVERAGTVRENRTS